MNFIAIDFETACGKDACSLGVVAYENGKVADKQHWLIRPNRLYFNPYNVAIHGITETDVSDKPTFKELWPELKKYFESQTVVAHNASFDMSVLRHQLDLIDEDYPNLNYICTYIISRNLWPGYSCYKLHILSKIFNIPLQHHDALSDAAACAELLNRACAEKNVSEIIDLLKILDLKQGYFKNNNYYPPSEGNYNYFTKRQSNIPLNKTICTEFDESHPMFNKSFVFTGTLIYWVREDAMQIVCDHGGMCEDRVTKKTNYLVLGIQDFDRFGEGHITNKMKTAEKYIQQGQDLKIISEDDFLKMIE